MVLVMLKGVIKSQKNDLLKVSGSKKKFFTSFWNDSILKWTLIIKWIIIKKLDFNGAIKTLRELETKPTLSNDYRDGINYSVSNLNGNNLPQTSLKHKNHNEPNNKKEKINMQTHARMKIFHKPKRQKKFLQTHKLKIVLNHSFLSF